MHSVGVSISQDDNLGAIPVSATPGSINFNGGQLQTTQTFTLNANRGLSVGTGTILTDPGTTLTVAGILAGNGSFSKKGSGTLILTGNDTNTGTANILAGALIIRNDAPALNGLYFTGTGTLNIEPAGTSFSTAASYFSYLQTPITLTGLTLGKEGNTTTITLARDITTAGTQKYYGPVAISNTITLSTSVGDIDFYGKIDSSTSTSKGLTLNVANGIAHFGDSLGSIQPLGQLTVNSPMGITVNGDIATTATTKLVNADSTVLKEIWYNVFHRLISQYSRCAFRRRTS